MFSLLRYWGNQTWFSLMKRLSLHGSTYFWPHFQDTHSPPPFGTWQGSTPMSSGGLTHEGVKFSPGMVFIGEERMCSQPGMSENRKASWRERGECGQGWLWPHMCSGLLSWTSQVQNIPSSQRVLLDRVRQTWIWLCHLQVPWIYSSDFSFRSFLICKMGYYQCLPMEEPAR